MLYSIKRKWNLQHCRPCVLGHKKKLGIGQRNLSSLVIQSVPCLTPPAQHRHPSFLQLIIIQSHIVIIDAHSQSSFMDLSLGNWQSVKSLYSGLVIMQISAFIIQLTCQTVGNVQNFLSLFLAFDFLIPFLSQVIDLNCTFYDLTTITFQVPEANTAHILLWKGESQ